MALTELQLQSLVIRAVKEHHGVAWKLSNRFLVGVPDLFIHIPTRFNTSGQIITFQGGTGVWEVKRKLYKAMPEHVLVEITPMQDRYLSELEDAGGISGVISFVSIGTDLFMSAFKYGVLAYSDPYLKKFEVARTAYTLLERGKRSGAIIGILERAYDAG